jgi:hypothetical protein
MKTPGTMADADNITAAVAVVAADWPGGVELAPAVQSKVADAATATAGTRFRVNGQGFRV